MPTARPSTRRDSKPASLQETQGDSLRANGSDFYSNPMVGRSFRNANQIELTGPAIRLPLRWSGSLEGIEGFTRLDIERLAGAELNVPRTFKRP